jgi:hypothetical protein
MAKRETSPDVEDVEDLLASARDSVDTIQLHRFDTREGGWSYVDRFDPGALRTAGIRETVRAAYGGGKFRARVRHPNSQWGNARTFILEGEPKRPAEASSTNAKEASTGPTTAAGASTGSLVEKVLVPIAVAIAGAFGTLAAKKLLESPQPDPLLLQLVKATGAHSGMDPLELQKAISEAEARGEARGRELGKLQEKVSTPRDSSPSKALGPSVVDAIDRNVPKLVGLLARKMDLDARRDVTVIGNPEPQPEPAEPVSTSTDPLVVTLLQVPRVARQFLLSAAESGEQAEVYAGLVLSKLDDVTYANMAGFLERPDFVDVFCTTYPAFADHREWVTTLAAAMKDSIGAAEDDDDDEASPEPASNVGT